MKVFFQHHEFDNLYKVDNQIFNKLFQTHSFRGVINAIINISKEFDKYSYSSSHEMRKYLFEIFGECLCTLLAGSEGLGIYNYSPIRTSKNISGIGLGVNIKMATINCKFIYEEIPILVERDLKKFAFESVVSKRIKKDNFKNIFVLTNARTSYFVTDSKFYKSIRIIGNDEISQMINGYDDFWDFAKKMVEDTIVKFEIFKKHIIRKQQSTAKEFGQSSF